MSIQQLNRAEDRIHQQIKKLLKLPLRMANGIPITPSVQCPLFQRSHAARSHDSVYWQHLPCGDASTTALIEIDRNHAVAIRGATERLRRFEIHQLKQHLLQPSRWLANVDRLAQKTIEVIDGQRDLESLLAPYRRASDRDQWSVGREVATLISIVHYLDDFATSKRGRRLQHSVGWIKQHARTLSAISQNLRSTPSGIFGMSNSLVTCLQLVNLRQSFDGNASLENAARLFQSPGFCNLDFIDPDESRQKLRKCMLQSLDYQEVSAAVQFQFERPTVRSCFINLAALLNRIATESQVVRNGVMEFVASVGCGDWLDQLDETHQKIEMQTCELDELRQQLLNIDDGGAWDAAEMQQIRARVAEMPEKCADGVGYLEDLAKVISGSLLRHRLLVKTIVRWVKCRPGNPAFQLRLLRLLFDLVPRQADALARSHYAEIFAEFLSCLIQVYRRRHDTKRFERLFDSGDSHRDSVTVRDLLSHWIDECNIRRRHFHRRARLELQQMVKGLEIAMEGDSQSVLTESLPSSKLVASMPVLFRVFHRDKALELLKVLQTRSLDFVLRQADCEIAKRLADNTEQCVAIAINGRFLYLNEAFQTILIDLAAKPATRLYANVMIRDGKCEQLRRLISWIHALKSLGGSIDIQSDPAVNDQWIESFPNSLHHALHCLNASMENTKAVAEQILEKSFPHREKLQREQEYLEGKLSQEGLSMKKRQALKYRLGIVGKLLANPPVVSSKRLSNLEGKIVRRAALETEKRMLCEVRHSIAEAMNRRGICLDVEQLSKKFFAALLQAIPTLDSQQETLAWKVLEEASKGRQYDCFRHAENVVFLEGIQSLGIDTNPWVDDCRTMRFLMPTNEVVTFGFAQNAMDYLLMGYHFRSCLAPGDCNFFSTITNAVDINKRVIYGRDADGQIVARCLLALDDQGRVVAFHVYSLRWHREMREAVRQFVAVLARDMNTTVGVSDSIETLVAEDWYDDGAVTLAPPTADQLSMQIVSLPDQPNWFVTPPHEHSHLLTPSRHCVVTFCVH